ncbi:MAG: serine/threonine protein kinase [Bdellovibrionales bacterium]|nr:serine/threonine protein kinase [Bdellovibrionales bacterium]
MIIRTREENEFYQLDPGLVLDSVEEALAPVKPGVRATGRTLTLNSLENRVYEIEMEDGSSVVAKFYRPGRWTREQILEEHMFLLALQDAEIPAIAPLRMGATTLAETPGNILFTVFPKVRGRLRDELSEPQIETLGRYLARIHAVGRGLQFRHRAPLDAETFGWKPLGFLLENGFIDLTYERRYRETVEAILSAAEEPLRKARKQVVHGDCHLGNVLWDGESPFFLDFDDSAVAPAVQDVWMVVNGRGEDAERDRALLLHGYDTMGAPFDRSSLALIESLRALRMIHYAAWIARRWNDPTFQRTFPDFPEPTWWEDEVTALEEVLRLIRGSSPS